MAGNKTEARAGPGLLLVLLTAAALLALTGAAYWALAWNSESMSPFVVASFSLAGVIFFGLSLKGAVRLLRAPPSRTYLEKDEPLGEMGMLVQSTHHPAAVTDSKGRILVANKWFEDLFLLEPGESVCMLTDPRIAALGIEKVFSRAALGESVALPETWQCLPVSKEPSRTRDVCLHGAFIPVRSATGRVGKVYVKFEDRSDRKRLEDQLRLDNSRLIAALEGARQVLCEIDPATGRVLVGMQQEQGGPGTAAGAEKSRLEELIHPDDRRELLERVRNQASTAGAYFRHRFRMRSDPGGWRWIQFQGTAFDLPGKGNQLVGTMVDITQEYESELQLKESEAKYRALFANAVEGMYLAGPDDAVICVNQAFARTLGYASPEEFEAGRLAGSFSRIYFIPRIREARLQALRKKGEVLQMETQAVRRDGTLVWISENARAVKDHQGNILYFEGSLTDITARKKREERLLHQALYDHRTNLPNRSYFTDKLEQCLKRAAQDQAYHFGLLFFDLDGFGAVNDSFGNFLGDRLLLEVSQRAREVLKAEDTLAHFSSDEFCVVAQGRGSSEMLELGEQLRQGLDQPFLLDGQEILISASVGILFYSMAYTRPEDMIRDAEMAMLQAKKQGKNRCVLFAAEMYQLKSRRTLMEKDLRRALDRNELLINYQPIILLDTGEIKGVEALVRWAHPEHGIISPGQFIPLAEETGLIETIGNWVLIEGCKQIRSWRDVNDSLILNVNLSGKQLDKPGLEQKLYQVLQDTNLNPACLNLEVTESMVMSNMDNNVRTLKRLKFMGLRLSIDDFGTGYSSLAHLQRFPLDELKIDRSFTSAIDLRQNKHIVRAIVELAQRMDLQLVVEGIETQTQLDLVKGYKCQYGQGFLFSRPMAPEQIEETWILPQSGVLPLPSVA